MHTEVQSAHKRHPESDVPPIYVHTDTLPDPHYEPIRIDHVGDAGVLITGHTGLYAFDIVPHVIAQLPDPHLRAYLDAYGGHHLALPLVRRDWYGTLQPWLWRPVQPWMIPARLRWPGQI